MTLPEAPVDANDESGLLSIPIELVVAVAEDDVIGRGGGLAWRLSSDLQHFKRLTLGHSILMGRKTHESIGRALPGRTNFVLSRSADFAAVDCIRVDGVNAALALKSAAHGSGDSAQPPSPLMVIGGAEVYRQCLPFARRIHLTLVHTRIPDGDTFFTGWRGAAWRETSRQRHAADDRNEFDYSFVTLDRVESNARAGRMVTGSTDS